mmetsp:Transcript_27598/g.67877  ORF Transcript_27598/g.67877 Transcript_27598/m.67877 type:complete len:227 (-) Transcript_27598:31-711(-)
MQDGAPHAHPRRRERRADVLGQRDEVVDGPGRLGAVQVVAQLLAAERRQPVVRRELLQLVQGQPQQGERSGGWGGGEDGGGGGSGVGGGGVGIGIGGAPGCFSRRRHPADAVGGQGLLVHVGGVLHGPAHELGVERAPLAVLHPLGAGHLRGARILRGVGGGGGAHHFIIGYCARDACDSRGSMTAAASGPASGGAQGGGGGGGATVRGCGGAWRGGEPRARLDGG